MNISSMQNVSSYNIMILGMQKNFKPFLIEISWILISILLTLLITGFIFDWSFLKSTLDIHLYDTYFVFSTATIVIPLFLLLNMVIFCIKETRHRFSRKLPGIIIFLSGLLLVICLTNLSKDFIRSGTTFSGGWTAYPPLSSLPEVHPGVAKEDPLVNIIVNSITVLQLLVILTLLYISFLWGTHKNSR